MWQQRNPPDHARVLPILRIDSEPVTIAFFSQPGSLSISGTNRTTISRYRNIFLCATRLSHSLGSTGCRCQKSLTGRYRSSTQGALVHRSEGLHGQGYALCLRCGRADSMLEGGKLPGSFVDDVDKQGPKAHKRLRGGKLNDREKHCPGNDSDWAILEGVRLGISTRTEIFEFQPRPIDKGEPLDRVTVYTLAAALRRALCAMLGIEDKEIGILTAPSRDSLGEATHSLFLYDTATGGAGYTSQIASNLPSLLRKARDTLACPSDCDAACQGCLLTHDTQHHLADLDRP